MTSIFSFSSNILWPIPDKSQTSLHLICCLHILSIWEESTILSPGKEFNSLSNHKILDRSKLKAFADDKINVTKEFKFVFGREENNVRKGKNAGYQHFLLFPQCFQMHSYYRVVKSRNCVAESLTHLHTMTPFDDPGKQAF